MAKLPWILLVAALVVFVIIGLAAWLQTRRLIRVGTDLTEQAKPFARELPGAAGRILVIGDSSAVGVGAADPTMSIAGRLGADFPTYSISNLGVSGSKTRDLIGRLSDLPSNERFDLILIQIGGNDIVRFTPLVDLKRDLPTVLSLAKQHSDRVLLLTSGNVGTSKLLPWGTRWLFTWRTKSVRKIFLAACSGADVAYIDLLRARKDDPYAQNPEKYYSADFFHPSGDGYGDWYSFVKPAVTAKMLQ